MPRNRDTDADREAAIMHLRSMTRAELHDHHRRNTSAEAAPLEKTKSPTSRKSPAKKPASKRGRGAKK